MARIKRVAREKEWTRKDDEDDDRARRIVEDEGVGRVRRGEGGTCDKKSRHCQPRGLYGAFTGNRNCTPAFRSSE